LSKSEKTVALPRHFQEFLRTFEIASSKLKSEANPQSSRIVPSLILIYFMINGLRATRASDTRCGALSLWSVALYG